MNDQEKIQLVNLIENFLKDKASSNDIPVLVGGLKKPFGIKGFIVAKEGHPVFEYKDRYFIYLESERELTEKVYDPKSQQFKTQVGYFTIAVPFYKETLSPSINFN